MKWKKLLLDRKGVTLVELLVTLVILGIAISAIASFFLATQKMSIYESDQRDAQSEVRLAMDAMLKEVRYATDVVLVSAADAEDVSINSIYLKNGDLVFKKNGSVAKTISGNFNSLAFDVETDGSLKADIGSIYRDREYSLQSIFNFPNLQLRLATIGGSGTTGAISFSFNEITGYATTSSITVTFNSNYGTPPLDSTGIVTYGSPYGTLPIIVQTDFTFSGWWTSPTGGSMKTPASIVTLNADHTLYAHWTPV